MSTSNRAALRVLAVLYAAVLAGCGSGGGEITEADAPSATTEAPAVESELDLDSESDSESASDSDAVADGAAGPVAAAEAFMNARSAYDVEATLALLAPDAAILDFGIWPREPEEYRGLFEWWGVHNWSWEPQDCAEVSAGPPTRVRCTHLIENDWSRAQEVDPVPGAYEFALSADGLISEVTRDSPAWGEVFRGWGDWLFQNHEADVQIMYRHDEDGRLNGGPATTPEALELFREYLPEYVEWEQNN